MGRSIAIDDQTRPIYLLNGYMGSIAGNVYPDPYLKVLFENHYKYKTPVGIKIMDIAQLMK